MDVYDQLQTMHSRGAEICLAACLEPPPNSKVLVVSFLPYASTRRYMSWLNQKLGGRLVVPEGQLLLDDGTVVYFVQSDSWLNLRGMRPTHIATLNTLDFTQ